MLFDIINFLFEAIKAIWNAPAWLVVSGIVLIAIVCFIVYLLNPGGGYSSYGGSNGRNSGESSEMQFTESNQFRITTEKIKQPFLFYDSNGDCRGRGDCFYDSKGYFRSWGDGFYDGKGIYRNWGENYYDACGYFRSWGDCFYDAKGNLIYPDW